MHIAKWGNSLAVRLPAAVVEGLALREGDDVQIRIAAPRVFEIERDTSQDDAMARIRSLVRDLPPGWRFDRDDAGSR